MRVSAINSSIYCKPRYKNLGKVQDISQDTINSSVHVDFKGKYDKTAVGLCGGLGAAIGGLLGFAIAGPVGAAAGAALVGGGLAKAQHDENNEEPPDPNESYTDIYFENHKYDY